MQKLIERMFTLAGSITYIVAKPTQLLVTTIYPSFPSTDRILFFQLRYFSALAQALCSSASSCCASFSAAILCTSALSNLVVTACTSSLASSETVVTAGRSSISVTAPGDEVSGLAQPFFRFSAAQAPQEERYAPARDEAACTVACAWVRSGPVTVPSQYAQTSSMAGRRFEAHVWILVYRPCLMRLRLQEKRRRRLRRLPFAPQPVSVELP